MPSIEEDRLSAYPKPDEDNWQDKYRVAYAKDEVYSQFLSNIQSWSKEAEQIEESDSKEPKVIV